MWKKGEHFILISTNSLYIIFPLFIVLISCKKKDDEIVMVSDKTYLAIPTKKEWYEDYSYGGNPIAYFNLDIDNNSNNDLLLKQNSFAFNGDYQSMFYIILGAKMYPLYLNNINDVKANSRDSLSKYLYLFYPSIYPNKTSKEIDLDSLEITTKNIIENGIIIYIPNSIDYKSVNPNQFSYIDKPTIIERKSKGFIRSEYTLKMVK